MPGQVRFEFFPVAFNFASILQPDQIGPWTVQFLYHHPRLPFSFIFHPYPYFLVILEVNKLPRAPIIQILCGPVSLFTP
jgi:hypothetical protein